MFMIDPIVVTVPQLGVNDDSVVVVRWQVADGEKVSPRQVICELETAKAVYDVESDVEGFIAILVAVGNEVPTGAPLALIGPDLAVLEAKCLSLKSLSDKKASALSERRATRKAVMLAEELGIDISNVVATGEIVREDDVRRYCDALRQDEVAITLTLPENAVPVAVYGAGRGGATVKETLDLAGSYQVVCFLDDSRTRRGQFEGLPVYDGQRLNDIIAAGVKGIFPAIADADIRLHIIRRCDAVGIQVINAIHPQAFISPSAKYGRGNHIKARAVVDTASVLGNGCIIDNGVMLAHDNRIGDGVHLAPGCSLGSSVLVAARTVIGIGASVSTGVTIGEGSIISIGSAVTRDVDPYSVVEGVPARLIGKSKRLQL